MLSKRMSNIWNTLAFRLTFLYAAIFFMSTFVALCVIYLFGSSIVLNLTDQGLLNEHAEFTSLYKQQGIDAVKNAAVIEDTAATLVIARVVGGFGSIVGNDRTVDLQRTATGIP